VSDLNNGSAFYTRILRTLENVKKIGVRIKMDLPSLYVLRRGKTTRRVTDGLTHIKI